ncbi:MULTISPECIES: DNA replication/repair protein RecF [Calditerrivibrio]|uniref:DNA replication and repair protein RecF n=1 Tax=Calditerrivibrio nitroreducens TaxID=477976 RepID=A0A2J6WM97_9BACT|nr:MAG: hypothetical protein C0187_03705 [Calditerrivibrio nitroreducens]
MFLKDIKLKNFRNHLNSVFSFDYRNYITGKNGSGKTSLLEGISVILTGKSFKTNRLKSLINIEKKFFEISSNFVENDVKYNISLYYDTKKRLTINGKRHENIINFYHNHPVIFYSPENEGFLSKEQEMRRNFLDRTIFYLDRSYIGSLLGYNKLLELKKKYILKDVKDRLLYKSIHEKMYFYTKEIHNKRSNLIKSFNTYIEKYLIDIPSFNTEFFSLSYIPNHLDEDILDKELIIKKVLSGPHRDRILFNLNGESFENIASFGQRKSLSLCCIYCFLKVVEDFSKKSIILLLDELESGLDVERVSFFMGLFDKYQYFLTGQSIIDKDINIIKLS